MPKGTYLELTEEEAQAFSAVFAYCFGWGRHGGYFDVAYAWARSRADERGEETGDGPRRGKAPAS